MGALPTLRAATDPAVVGGEYFGPDGLGEQRGHPRRRRPVTPRAGPSSRPAGCGRSPRSSPACATPRSTDASHRRPRRPRPRGWTSRGSVPGRSRTSPSIEGGTQNILLRFTRDGSRVRVPATAVPQACEQRRGHATRGADPRRARRLRRAPSRADRRVHRDRAARCGLLPDGAGRRLQRHARAARAAPLRPRDAAAHGARPWRTRSLALARGRSRRHAASATSAASTAGPSGRSAAGVGSSTGTPSSTATPVRTSRASTRSAVARRAPPREVRPGLMHGDFHFANVIIRPDAGDLAAVVDWELATIGDPLLDLGHLLATWPVRDGGSTPDRRRRARPPDDRRGHRALRRRDRP